jgi:hypothetical protein
MFSPYTKRQRKKVVSVSPLHKEIERDGVTVFAYYQETGRGGRLCFLLAGGGGSVFSFVFPLHNEIEGRAGSGFIKPRDRRE